MDLNLLLSKVQKSKDRKCFVKTFGTSQKAIEFQSVINNLNLKYNTNYYLERDGRSFFIEGHREHGPISRRDGILGKDISLTIDLKDLDKAGSEHTVKMIIDNNLNYAVFSLTKMKEDGLLDMNIGHRFRTGYDGKTCRFCIWELSELSNVLLYKNIITWLYEIRKSSAR